MLFIRLFYRIVCTSLIIFECNYYNYKFILEMDFVEISQKNKNPLALVPRKYNFDVKISL